MITEAATYTSAGPEGVGTARTDSALATASGGDDLVGRHFLRHDKQVFRVVAVDPGRPGTVLIEGDGHTYPADVTVVRSLMADREVTADGAPVSAQGATEADENDDGMPSSARHPLRAQYLRLKGEYPGRLLLFRLADFYELYDDDALVGARELVLPLLTRAYGEDETVPMVAVHAPTLDACITALVGRGHAVAVAEYSDPADVIGLCERVVSRVVPPMPSTSEAPLATPQADAPTLTARTPWAGSMGASSPTDPGAVDPGAVDLGAAPPTHPTMLSPSDHLTATRAQYRRLRAEADAVLFFQEEDVYAVYDDDAQAVADVFPAIALGAIKHPEGGYGFRAVIASDQLDGVLRALDATGCGVAVAEVVEGMCGADGIPERKLVVRSLAPASDAPPSYTGVVSDIPAAGGEIQPDAATVPRQEQQQSHTSVVMVDPYGGDAGAVDTVGVAKDSPVSVSDRDAEIVPGNGAVPGDGKNRGDTGAKAALRAPVAPPRQETAAADRQTAPTALKNVLLTMSGQVGGESAETFVLGRTLTLSIGPDQSAGGAPAPGEVLMRILEWPADVTVADGDEVAIDLGRFILTTFIDRQCRLKTAPAAAMARKKADMQKQQTKTKQEKQASGLKAAHKKTATTAVDGTPAAAPAPAATPAAPLISVPVVTPTATPPAAPLPTPTATPGVVAGSTAADAALARAHTTGKAADGQPGAQPIGQPSLF